MSLNETREVKVVCDEPSHRRERIVQTLVFTHDVHQMACSEDECIGCAPPNDWIFMGAKEATTLVGNQPGKMGELPNGIMRLRVTCVCPLCHLRVDFRREKPPTAALEAATNGRRSVRLSALVASVS